MAVEKTRFSDTLLGGVLAGGRSRVAAHACEFVRNEPASVVIQEDAVVAVEACGFSQHGGNILQTRIYGAVGTEIGFGGRPPEGSVMEIANSRDFLGTSVPWVTDGRPATLVTRNNNFDCRTSYELYEQVRRQ